MVYDVQNIVIDTYLSAESPEEIFRANKVSLHVNLIATKNDIQMYHNGHFF